MPGRAAVDWALLGLCLDFFGNQCSQSSSQRLDWVRLNGAGLNNPAAWLDGAWLNEAGLFTGLLPGQHTEQNYQDLRIFN